MEYYSATGINLAPGQDAQQDVDLTKAEGVFKVFVNPLQVWLWIGAVIVLLGTITVLGPRLPAFLLERETKDVRVRAPA